MLGYVELTAKPHQPLHFELALSIFNPSSDSITAVWHVELPPGIREPDGRRAFSGRTVVPAHRKVEANRWLIAADSDHAYIHELITARAELSAPDRHFSDEFRASIVQIRVA